MLEALEIFFKYFIVFSTPFSFIKLEMRKKISKHSNSRKLDLNYTLKKLI